MLCINRGEKIFRNFSVFVCQRNHIDNACAVAHKRQQRVGEQIVSEVIHTNCPLDVFGCLLRAMTEDACVVQQQVNVAVFRFYFLNKLPYLFK